jgi:hypothetical protein
MINRENDLILVVRQLFVRRDQMKIVNLYKTNVDDQLKADVILDEIGQDFPDSRATLDLEDCDKVLRIESLDDRVDEQIIRIILTNHGYQIEDLV